jgi:hypothetical protein
MRSFITCVLYQIVLGWLSQEWWDGWGI